MSVLISDHIFNISLLDLLRAFIPTLLSLEVVSLKLSKIFNKSPLGKEGSDIISARIVPSLSIVFQGRNEPSGNLTEYLPPLIKSSLKDLTKVRLAIISSSKPALRKPSVIRFPNLPKVVLVLVAI